MPRPRIAAVITEYRRYSHAEHILDRFLWGYGFGGRHHVPPMDLVALYTDQVPESDLSRARAKLFPQMKIYPTIADTLCRGGQKLAVDGVLLIGEHGNYPFNEMGQHLYPRYEFFREIVKVFRDSGRSVPVFSDKHLSWKWEWAREMVETSKELAFPLLAGSSLPCARRVPSVEMPLGADVREAVCVAVGGPDSYDIHALEGMQCLVERRKGGETGVEWIHALRGAAAFQAMQAGRFNDGGWDNDLFTACLCRSHNLVPARNGFNHLKPELDHVPALFQSLRTPEGKPLPPPVVYRYRHRDGLKMTMILIEGLVHDFTFAATLKGHRQPFSLAFHLPAREVCNFFSPQVHHIETMFLTGRAPYPVERTLLTTGLSAAGVESLWQGQKRLRTGHLKVEYQPTAESTFWRS